MFVFRFRVVIYYSASQTCIIRAHFNLRKILRNARIQLQVFKDIECIFEVRIECDIGQTIKYFSFLTLIILKTLSKGVFQIFSCNSIECLF